MEQSDLIGAQVELSAPDGRVFCFHVNFLAPYAGETYAVLEHDADGQLLVTTVEPAPDGQGQVAFTVVGEEDIISAVLEKLAAYSVTMALENEAAQDEDDCDCGCGHAHEHHDGDCCCHHHHDENGHRHLPSYIKKA